MNLRTAIRILALPVFVFGTGWGAAAFGQSSTDERNPFPPFGFNGNPDQSFESLFGVTTPDEEAALAKIEITAKEEREFGQPQVEAYIDSLKQQGMRVFRKGKEVDYLNKLVKTIQPYLKNARRYPKLVVYVVDSPRVDARSFPGGSIFFFKGLLTHAENEAALVGIVGHELSHLDRGHLVFPLKRARLLQERGGAENFDPKTFFTSMGTMMRLTSRPFRPEDESTADADGAEWAYRAGYDPRELAALFNRLHKQGNDPKLPFGAFFRTHPYSDDRAAAIFKRYDELQARNAKETFYVGKKNLEQRIPKSEQEFDD